LGLSSLKWGNSIVSQLSLLGLIATLPLIKWFWHKLTGAKAELRWHQLAR
jgi:hypothetical protein